MKTPLFYKQKPFFGIDIGRNAVKIVQLENCEADTPRVTGYGQYSFDPNSISRQGVILDIEAVAKAVYQLVDEHMVGNIISDRCVTSLPSARTYNHILTLPKMKPADLIHAVRNEAEQYIPMPIDELYVDYEVTQDAKDKNTCELLLVASPKTLVDSYMQLFSALGLEVSLIETSVKSVTRAVRAARVVDGAAIIVDFGSLSSDLSIFDGNTIRVTGTTKQGGDDLTDILVSKLGITKRQALHGKAKYGIKQTTKQGREIYTHAKPMLEAMVTEVKKMVRYYRRRDEAEELKHLVLVGGGSNLPGLNEFIAKQTGLVVRSCNPWANTTMGSLQAPNKIEAALYTTAVGSALLTPKEVAKS